MSEIAAVSVTSIDQPRGVDAVAGELALDVARASPRSVTDSAERLIATRAPRVAGSRAQQRGDLAEHHPVDLADQPVALGRRQEARRARSARPSGSSARRTSAS